MHSWEASCSSWEGRLLLLWVREDYFLWMKRRKAEILTHLSFVSCSFFLKQCVCLSGQNISSSKMLCKLFKWYYISHINVFHKTSVCCCFSFSLRYFHAVVMSNTLDSHLWRLSLLHCPVFQIARQQREKKKWWEQKSTVSNFLSRKDQMYKAKIVLVLVQYYQSLPNLQHCKASLLYNFVLQRYDVICFVSLSRNDTNF